MESRAQRSSRRSAANKNDPQQASNLVPFPQSLLTTSQRPAKKRRTDPAKPLKPTIESGKSKWTTYRVSPIPSTYDAVSFQTALCESLQLGPHTKPTIHSFASYRSHERTATITFSDLPLILSPASPAGTAGGKTEWLIDIVHPLSRQLDRVCIDVNFSGFTPLSPLVNDAEHIIEYVTGCESLRFTDQ